MEIIKKSSISQSGKFRVLRAFCFKSELKENDVLKPPGPVFVKPGDEIEIREAIEQVSLCKCGKVAPILPPVAVYIALRPIVLPGESEKFEAKIMELVEMRAVDAGPLLLSGDIIPRDDTIWRPFGKTLKQKPRGLTQKQIDEYEAERFRQKNWELGILQKKK